MADKEKNPKKESVNPVEAPKDVYRKVHCDACAQNYLLKNGAPPVCCEKPNISDL